MFYSSKSSVLNQFIVLSSVNWCFRQESDNSDHECMFLLPLVTTGLKMTKMPAQRITLGALSK